MAVSVFLRGGLGNQLFQYAMGLHVARRQRDQLILRTDLLPLTPDFVANASRWPNQICDFRSEGTFYGCNNQPPGRTNSMSKAMQALRMIGDFAPVQLLKLGIIAGETTKAPDTSKLGGIWLINSYCSSAQPAIELGDDLRAQIQDLVAPTSEFLKTLEESKSANPVIVHLRLGDYKNFPSLYGVLNLTKVKDYLDTIVEVSSTPIWIFTDSPEDVREDAKRLFGDTRILGPDELTSPIENMLIMSSGSQLVCANSTFSWWAAFLMGDDGKVHYPKSKVATVDNFGENMILSGWRAYESD